MNAYITNSVGNNILKVAAGGVSYTRFDTTVTMVKPYGCKFDPNGNMWLEEPICCIDWMVPLVPSLRLCHHSPLS